MIDFGMTDITTTFSCHRRRQRGWFIICFMEATGCKDWEAAAAFNRGFF